MSNRQTVADLAPATRYARREGVRLAWTVLHGTDDILIPAANARSIADRIPGARLPPLPGCGHLVWDMDGGASIKAIRGFVEEAG
ncbi:MAG TPA: hypothetical protein VFA86_15140 [Gammaproteobacteria bacterium]|nr:hypothetical protein [Gammaproteobacteria bacterium]